MNAHLETAYRHEPWKCAYGRSGVCTCLPEREKAQKQRVIAPLCRLMKNDKLARVVDALNRLTPCWPRVRKESSMTDAATDQSRPPSGNQETRHGGLREPLLRPSLRNEPSGECEERIVTRSSEFQA
jgi:hypothetical protein